MATSLLPNRSRSRCTRRGFTLVELLIAAALGVMVTGLLLAMTGQLMRAWSSRVERRAAEADAMRILDQLSADFQAAIFRDSGAVWLAATILDHTENSGIWETGTRQKPPGAQGSLKLDTESIREARFGQAGVWLRWFTHAYDRQRLIDEGERDACPVAVAYQIIRRRCSPSERAAYVLHRSQVRPSVVGDRPGTLETGFDLDPALVGNPYHSATEVTNDGTAAGDPIVIRSPRDVRHALADHVVDFGVRLHLAPVDDAAGEWMFPGAGVANSHFARSPPGAMSDAYPVVVDVMIRILTKTGARRLANFEEGPVDQDAGSWWDIVEQNSAVFVRRIALPVGKP